jgi:hypothetical protein
MSDPIYVIDLGSGLYLDNDGVLHQGPIPQVPTYTPPGGVLSTANEVSKLSKTFNDIGNALPSKSDGEQFTKFAKKLSDLGAPAELSELLGVVGKVASTLGTVFVVLGVAVAAAKLLGLFNEGPSPLEILVKARFDALDTEIRALHALAVEQHLDHQRDALTAARSTVQEFVGQRDSGTMTAAQIESRLQTLITLLSLLSDSEVIALIDPITYTVLFDADEYQKVWPWIATNLFRIPAGSAPQRATFPAVNTPFFDHRMAVLLAPQAAQTFLALIQSLSPEFRTKGDFRSHIRDFADALANMAKTLRNTGLARIEYTESDFGLLIDDFYVSDLLPGITEPILEPDYGIVVGAMDLCNHNDAFFSDVSKGAGVPFPGPSKRGSLDFRWHPPAKLVRDPLASHLFHSDGSPVVQYRIVNPKECADAANDQSLQDYSDLLVSSGYMTLVSLSAQLRHATTQPDKSETVIGSILHQRHPQPRSEVTVVSAPGPILFTATGEIKAQASREPQKVRAFASCSTQPIPRTPPLIHYRVLLRTLSSASPPRGWSEPNYNAVQSASYIADPLHPGFQRLALETSSAAVLDERFLIEGSSQAEARHVERTLDFKAHTFDWWIPVQPLHGVSDEVFVANHDQSVFGNPAGRSPGGLPRPIPQVALSLKGALSTDPASAASVVLGLGWEDGNQTWQGQHRETKEATVQMHVRLDWQGNHLRVAIENRPEDRNYIIFLVVEETFGFIESDEQPPKVLHTAFPIAINGQLTFVPQSLFDQEKAASDKQRAFADRFAVSVQPEPGEPVFGAIRLGELTTSAGAMRLAAALRQFEPEVLEKLIRNY